VIETALKGYLGAQTALTALIGDRLTPGYLKENALLPAVVYFRVSTPRTYGIGGPMGFAQPRFQFSAYGNGYLEVIAVIDAIRVALDGFSGTMGDTTVREIESDGEIDHYDSSSKSFHRSIDFYIAHEE
jgi:hypothetical protein